MSEIDLRVEESINLLKEHEPTEGYFVSFSGGKDSTVMYDLVKKSGVKFDVHYNVTTIEPPELIDFIKANYPEVDLIYPKLSMWELIEKKGMLPLRMVRYCTKELKSDSGEGRTVVTGIRSAAP